MKLRIPLEFVTIFHVLLHVCHGSNNIHDFNSVDPWEQRRCEKIEIPQCKDMPYNLTMYPNLAGSSSQKEAEQSFNEYMPLIQVGCSPHLRFFLCSVFAPMCSTEVDYPIPSCQSVCEEVKARCIDTLAKFSLPWPIVLECSKFPGKNDKETLCMEHPGINDVPTRATVSEENDVSIALNDPTNNPAIDVQCPENFLPSVSSRGFSCIPACHVDIRFSSYEKHVLEVVLAILTSLAMISSAFTVLTFAVSHSRFQYPERPVCFIAICYFILSLAFLVRFIGGRQLSCNANHLQEAFLTLVGMDSPAGCIIEFLLLYFFHQAGCLWWIILTVSWFLSTSKKWSSEAFESTSKYFHMVVWGVSIGLTMSALLLKKVDADELTGICSVGNLDRDALLFFVAIPSVCYLFCGGSLVIAGLIGGVQVRNAVKQDHQGSHKIDVLIYKVGLFSLSFILCLAGLAACGLVEYVLWNDTLTDGVSFPKITSPVFYVRAIAPLVLGALVGFWVCSRKTLQIWKRLCCSCCKSRYNVQVKGAMDYQEVTQVPLRGQWKASMNSSPTNWTHPTSGSDKV